MAKTLPENHAIRNRAYVPGGLKSGVTKLTAIPSNAFKKPLHTRRTQARVYRKSNIRFSESDSTRFHDALMRNESTNGMYFETNIQLTPGTLININVVPAPYMGTWSPDNMYTAEIRWCRRIKPDSARRFGVGVRFCPPLKQ